MKGFRTYSSSNMVIKISLLCR